MATNIDPAAVQAHAERVTSRPDVDPDIYQLAVDVLDLLALVQSAVGRLQAVKFLADMYGDDGEVPVDEIHDALEGEMVVAYR